MLPCKKHIRGFNLTSNGLRRQKKRLSAAPTRTLLYRHARSNKDGCKLISGNMLIPLPIPMSPRGDTSLPPFLRTDYAGAFKRARNNYTHHCGGNEPIKCPISPRLISSGSALPNAGAGDKDGHRKANAAQNADRHDLLIEIGPLRRIANGTSLPANKTRR